MSDAWRNNHPWASLYDFVVEREQLAAVLGRVFIGTDIRRLYRAAEVIGEMPDGAAILDIPCGGGVALRGLRPDQRVRYVAADIAEAMLERTRREAARRGLGQVELTTADVEALPFADGEFDLILSFTGLHCFPHPRAAVDELARCLKPGGRLSGSAFLTGSGVRYEPVILAGRAGGLMGPSASAPQLREWLAETGLEHAALERSGGLTYFTARCASRAT